MKAYKLFRSAAYHENSQALNNVAAMYFEGEGVEQNYIKAYAWWTLALKDAKKDYVEMDSEVRDIASCYLNYLKEEMTDEDIKEAEALASILNGEPQEVFTKDDSNILSEEEHPEFEISIPKYFKLYANYPNPFNPTTTIKFDIPERNSVLLNIYNIST